MLKIISLVPSQTELLYDLGLESQIVGVTKFCVHPENARKEKQIVGGTKTIHLDKIKELKPSIILCNKEENTKEIVENCKQICQVHVSEIYTLEDAINLILEYGSMFNVSNTSKNIAVRLKNELHNFKQFIKDYPVVNVAYFIWKNPWMVAANNTFINYLLELNNYRNSYHDQSRYPEVTISHLKTDYVFLSSEPFPFQEKHVEEIKSVVKNAKVLLVDGEYFSWYGTRLLDAFDYFKQLRLKLHQT